MAGVGQPDLSLDRDRRADRSPTVSAVIPCYNGERFIGQAIRHLLDQTRPPDELIVVDDGSTDGSAAIIAEFPQVRLIRHEVNQGLPTGRNHAWQAATGEIIVYVDVDAYAAHGFVAAIVAAFDDPAVGAVSGAGHEVHGRPAANRWRQAYLPQNYGPEPRDDVPFLFGICASFRRSVLAEVGGFDPAFRTNGEDVDICLRLRHQGYRIVYTPAAEVYHHRDDDLRSLLAMIRRWWLWGHRAHLKNGVPYLWGHLKDTWKMMAYVVRRAWAERAPRLMGINLLFFVVAHWAILQARWLGPPSAEEAL